MKIKIVWGCPCSGKTTYVRSQMGDGDLVYDYDAVLQALTNNEIRSTELHTAHELVKTIRAAFIDFIRADTTEGTAFIISSRLTDDLKQLDAEVYFHTATKAECYERLQADETRTDKAAWQAVIDKWFDDYEDKKQKGRAMKNKKFWNWQTDADTGTRTLNIDGVIAEESWFGDEITPKQFADELKGKGDITLWINSPGGDCIAASRIYTMLKDYPGKITVKIDGMAASAASVIAMAGDEVLMSPPALMMIHNPWTVAMGDSDEMQKASEMLNEVKESIINAYVVKTGLSRNKLAKLMDDETWMNARKATELGFADAMLFDNKKPQTENSYSYSQKAVMNCLLNKLPLDEPIKKTEAAPLMERLNNLKH